MVENEEPSSFLASAQSIEYEGLVCLRNMGELDETENNASLTFDTKTDYLALPAIKLLDAYGAGSHIPGSGSAAVLSAVLAVEMMRTVCKQTLKRDEYQEKWAKCEFILSEIESKAKPRLIELFRNDINIFNQVSVLRSQRDHAENESQKRHWERVHLDELKKATEIPIEVARISMDLLPSSFYLFDEGRKAVRGDSGVAVSSLLSAISGALFIIFLNLRSYSGGKWLEETRQTAAKLAERFERLQVESFERVLRLYDEGIVNDEKQLTLNFLTGEERN